MLRRLLSYNHSNRRYIKRPPRLTTSNTNTDTNSRQSNSNNTNRKSNMSTITPMEVSFTTTNESEVGITQYTSPQLSFSGVIKQRFSDFIVREVSLNNEITTLKNCNIDEIQEKYFKKIHTPITDYTEERINEIVMNLKKLVGGEGEKPNPDEDMKLINFIKDVISNKESTPLSIVTFPCEHKEKRREIHEYIRTHLGQYVESELEYIDSISHFKLVHKKNNTNKSRFIKQTEWPKNLGNFLKFTLYKENIDTISACSDLLFKLKMHKKTTIDINGTKDKRAITTQKCTVYRKQPKELIAINNFQSWHKQVIKIGDFEYVNQPCQLGHILGNYFQIVLRSVNSNEEQIHQVCNQVKTNGFINYFGLQRFGSGATRSHMIGLGIFKGNYLDTINLFFTIQNDCDKPEVIAAKKLFAEKKYQEALDIIPKYMNAERNILGALVRDPHNFEVAFNSIDKKHRLLYVNAYQSYIWNLSVSERIRRYGLRLIPGDLVVSSKIAKDTDEFIPDTAIVSNDEDVIENDSFGKRSTLNEDEIHFVTEEDIANNTYSMKDLLFPLTGSGVKFPKNDIGTYIMNLLSKDGLNIETAFTKSPLARMQGAYRRVLQYASNFKWSIVYYPNKDDTLVVTEFDNENNVNILDNNNIKPEFINPANKEDLICGVVLNFTLKTGVYATMLLREITKESTDSGFQTQLVAEGDDKRLSMKRNRTDSDSRSNSPEPENAAAKKVFSKNNE